MLHKHASQPNPEKLGRAGLAAFLTIAKKWDLAVAEQIILLGNIPESTFHVWRKKVEEKKEFKLSQDILERISYILGIYKNLNILLPDERAANEWIRKPNKASLFSNQSALSKMLAGHVVDLADVRRFLDGQRGANYF